MRAASPRNPLLRSLSRPHGFEPLRVEGRLPEGLRGTLFRAGPGLFERFGKPVAHAFETDGAITAVRFGDGMALGATRIVESAGYRDEEAAGRFLYNSSASWLDRMRIARRGSSKSTGNTSAFLWQDRLFGLMEGGLPQEMDQDTLETLDATDLGVIPGAFSAHPHRVASLRTTFNFGLRYGRKMQIDLFALPDEGPARKLGTLEAPWQSMVHDFIATERHILLLLGPVELNLLRAMAGLADITKLFRWRPELGSRLFVVPLDDVNAARTYELDPFWAWHIANAFEEGGGPSLDICRLPTFGLDETDLVRSDGTAPLLTRLHLDFATGKASETRLFDVACELPQIAPQVAGGRYGTVFAQTERLDGNERLRGVTRIDLAGERSAEWLVPNGHIPSEPMLVARGEAEDDAWVLDLVYDGGRDTSYLAVLDGQRLEEGPVATVHFDQPIPITFHGAFAAARW
ncbi:carotenoid oxygenase family protein [Vulgatibacter incomptus]|uniref:Dioxygenase, putative n=1 Tax=Vulgatibacter incomptus TaxID=1391653 RepID=A0A0K1PEG1_9BACT|nr:carotenoid oxygenase family protein [Vulgatibacter incomptus]AKU91801.1 dioxygenase, putative [Vulgatibacter incomptus]